MKKVITILIILIALLSIFAAYLYFTQEAEETNNLEPGNDEIALDIILPKSAKVGEQFSGDYYIKYDGEPFEAMLIYVNSRQGFDNEYIYGFTTGVFSDIDSTIEGKDHGLIMGLIPFRLDSYGGEYSPHFFEEGIYNYALFIYDCGDIEKNTGKKCKDYYGLDIAEVEKVLPLKPRASISDRKSVV